MTQNEHPIKPTSTRIMVLEDSFQYTGRIVIPDKVQRRPTTGMIVAVGEDVGKYKDIGEVDKNTGMPVTTFVATYKVGERVVYGLYAGTVINLKGYPAYRMLTEDEVLGWVIGKVELEGVGTV